MVVVVPFLPYISAENHIGLLSNSEMEKITSNCKIKCNYSGSVD